MKTSILHKPVIILFLLTGFLFLTCCERLDNVTIEEFDCYNCYQQKPEWVRLNITVTINDENPVVPLKVYIGDIEDGVLDWVDTTSQANYWVEVKPDATYSVVAEYKENAKTILAVDDDEVKLKKNTTDCDAPCYYQSGGYTDVRLIK